VPNLTHDISGRKETTMRAASPLIVVLVVLSWILPAQAGAQTPISGVDKVVRKAVPPRTDSADDLSREVQAVVKTATAVVQEVFSPAPDVAVTSAPASPQVVPKISTPRRDTAAADSSPAHRSAKRSGGRAQKAHKRSPTRRHNDRAETSTLQARDTRQPDKRRDIYRVASAGNDIHPTEVKGLTLTASRQTALAVTGFFLLNWQAGALFIIGLGVVTVLTSRPRPARLPLRA
jgi:hypothetical protein